MHNSPCKNDYETNGAILVPGLLNDDAFFDVEQKLLNVINSQFSCNNLQNKGWVEFASQNPDTVSELYMAVANLPESIALGKHENITSIIRLLIGERAKIYEKIPLRIDVPLETKELAAWHQDDFYVKGAPNEVTAWIPLQDTAMHNGALSVMKQSHKHGKIPHTIHWGKKTMPEGVFDLPIHIMEMKRGDVLFFNSYTLHTGNMNFSQYIRYSLQMRYTSRDLGAPSTLMGTVYDL